MEYQNTRILGGKAGVIKIEGVVLNRVVTRAVGSEFLKLLVAPPWEIFSFVGLKFF